MSILRDELLVALNDLIVACREVAKHHSTAAELTTVEALSKELKALSRDRLVVANDLSSAVQATGDIADAPNDEKLMVQDAAARFVTAVSIDETARLLKSCKAKEERIAELATTALGHKIDEELRKKISSLRTDATTRLDRLTQDRLSS